MLGVNMKRICEICGKEYESNSRKYLHCCSNECLKKKKYLYETPRLSICKNCGKEYFISNPGYSWNKNNELVKVKGSAQASSHVLSDNYCCYECGKKHQIDKSSKTSIERYNGIGFASKELKDKALKTTKDRYGDENYTNREQVKQTCLEKYGADNISKSEYGKKLLSIAIKNAHKERGNEIIAKTKATKLERYGNENYNNRNLAKNTCMEKYGVDSYSKTKEYKEKSIQTNLIKRGVKYPLQDQNVKDLMKINNLKKYGVESVFQLDEVKEKKKQTVMKNLNVEYPLQSKEIQEKYKKYYLEKYGVEYAFQVDEIKQKIKETNLKKYGFTTSTKSKEVQEKSIKTCLDKYGVPYPCMTQQCREADPHTISKLNKAFAEKLNKENIKTEFEFHLNKYSYDIKMDNNILIEINPTITHSSSDKKYIPLLRFNSKDKNYHLNKFKNAIENGYTCINIWDWDDESKILNLLKEKEKIYARELKIKEVSIEETTLFLNNYHLQNTCKGQEIRLGLFKDNELIQLMTFGKPRYNKNYQYELIRLCTQSRYKVIGGAEKLFNYFRKTYNPDSIISYCDNSKFKGDVYTRLGMKLIDFGKPSKHWFNIKTKRHITDNLLKQRGYSQLHNDKEHVKGESNQLLMLEAGYLEIYDCGQSTYVWCAS